MEARRSAVTDIRIGHGDFNQHPPKLQTTVPGPSALIKRPLWDGRIEKDPPSLSTCERPHSSSSLSLLSHHPLFPGPTLRGLSGTSKASNGLVLSPGLPVQEPSVEHSSLQNKGAHEGIQRQDVAGRSMVPKPPSLFISLGNTSIAQGL